MDDICGSGHAPDLRRWCAAETELSIPAVYTHREPMARLAALIRREQEMPFCLLPFCHTLEAEALGAQIRFARDGTGPRVSRSPCETLAQVLTRTLDPTVPRIAETLAAARLLTEAGETVVFQLSGPLTILNSLLSSEQIYRSLRREPELFLEVCRKLGQDVLTLAGLAETAGVGIFSYADPMAAAGIIGPRGSRLVAEGYLAALLKALDRQLGPDALVCLCPKTAASLLDAELASERSHPLPAAMPYPEALMTVGGRLRFAAQGCIHNGKPVDAVREIVVKMAAVRIRQTGQVLECPVGTNLLQLLTRRQIWIENPCNGKGTCGKCGVRLCAGAFSGITPTERGKLKPTALESGIRLACEVRILGDGEIELPDRQLRYPFLSEGYCPEFQRDPHLTGIGAAVDIGTTTMVLSLVDLAAGRTLAFASGLNPQRAFGMDVLTRISYVCEQGEAATGNLQRAVVDGLNDLLRQACAEAQVEPETLREIVVAANCAMTHMLLGADVRPLGRAPYEPVFRSARSCRAVDIGIAAGQQTMLCCLPQVSAFIGGDVVAGARVCGLHRETGNVLFIDIGTNGEILLAAGGRLLGCSCAAGPALEGMNIRCGMVAAEGAVEELRITDHGVELETIGNAPPAGLCGSGILAVVRELAGRGYVRKTGVYVPVTAQPSPAILRLDGTKREAVLCTEPEIVVTQEDIRQVQLAKGAIASGITVLLQAAGIGMEALDRIIVAGQFGFHLPAESLTGVGLLPEEVRDKLVYVGNAARSGAEMALLSRAVRREMEQLAVKIDYIDLVRTENYERIFSDSMAFPVHRRKQEEIPNGRTSVTGNL